MLAEIFMLRAEADARSLKAMTPVGKVARFVPIELPVSSAGDGPLQQVDSNKSTATVWVLNRATQRCHTDCWHFCLPPGLIGSQWSNQQVSAGAPTGDFLPRSTPIESSHGRSPPAPRFVHVCLGPFQGRGILVSRRPQLVAVLSDD